MKGGVNAGRNQSYYPTYASYTTLVRQQPILFNSQAGTTNLAVLLSDMNIHELDLSLTSNLRQQVRKWPLPLAECCRIYFDTEGRPALGKIKTNQDIAKYSFWLLLPIWFGKQHCECDKPYISKDTLAEVLLAQFFIYLFVRIHDDLADRKSHGPILPAVAQQFLIEGDRILARYLGRDEGFWSFYRDALQKTSWNAIWLADWQKLPSTDWRKIKKGYEDEGAILNVASAAVCHLQQRVEDMKIVRQFGAAMTVAGQVLDDLRDLGEDLAQGKINLAANLMLRAAERAGVPVELTADSLVESAVRSGGFADILDLVARQLARAKAAARRLELPEAVALVERYQKWPKAMKEEIHHRRADALFASIKR